MYLPTPLFSPEHQLAASPFQRLGLLKVLPALAAQARGMGASRAPAHFGFCPPRSEEVPALVVLAVLLEWAGKLLPLRDLLSGPGHIGRTFGLTQQTLFDVFTSLRTFAPAWCPTVEHIGRQAWVTVPTVPVAQVLHDYYASELSR